MEEFLKVLWQHIEIVKEIGNKIESREGYMEEIRAYLPSLDQMITAVFQLIQAPEIRLNINQEFVLQVLTDIMYGIEHEDAVFLLDTLRYGLLEVYYYIRSELQDEGAL